MNNIEDLGKASINQYLAENVEQISYEEEFEELRCIGRGNFGAAFVVRFKNAPDNKEQYFIAKKIILGQLTPKEQEGAHLEVS